MLKLDLVIFIVTGNLTQPPSGGCVLKPYVGPILAVAAIQPPSGGCVLKQLKGRRVAHGQVSPAAFRRLCVETHN